MEGEDFDSLIHSPAPALSLPHTGVHRWQGLHTVLCGGDHVHLSHSCAIHSSFPAEPSVCPAVPVSDFSLLHTFHHSRHPTGCVCLKVYLCGDKRLLCLTGHPLGAANSFRAPCFLDLGLSYFYFMPSF